MNRKYSDSQWQEDIHFTVMAMRRIHPNLFHSVPENIFENEVSALTGQVPYLTDNEIIVGLLKLTALTKDWHTQIISKNLTDRWYPIRVEQLQDGVFILAASPEYAQYLGAKVLKIGNYSASEAFTKLEGVTAHDNSYSQRYFSSMFVSMPSILAGLHISDKIDTLPLEIQRTTNEIREVSISAQEFESDDDFSWYWQKESAPTKKCVTLTTHGEHPPMYWKNTDQFYWFELLERYQTVYMGFNMTLDDEDENFTDFNNRLWKFIDRQKVNRLVIDLRHNLGGDRDILEPLIQGILQRECINRRNNLFVLIGPKNVSASSHCAAWLEKKAHPTFVGEHTGARPNQYADPEQVRLPNSQLRLMVSKRYWQNDLTENNRQSITPHILAGFTSSDYFTQRDPAIEKLMGLFEAG